MGAASIAILVGGLLGILMAGSVASRLLIASIDPDWLGRDEKMWLSKIQTPEQERDRKKIRANMMDVYRRVGVLQARLQNLGSMESRVAKLSGLDLPAISLPPMTIAFEQPALERAEGAAGKGEVRADRGYGGDLPGDASLSTIGDIVERRLDRLGSVVESSSDRLVAMNYFSLEKKNEKSFQPSSPPVKYWVSSGFGMRIDPFDKRVSLHPGLDYPVPEGTLVRAAAGGVVDYAAMDAGYGNMVEIDHGNGYVTRYAHNSKVLVKDGQIVKQGQQIAISGDTGRSTGSHVHFEVRYNGVAVNPVKFLKNETFDQTRLNY